MKLGFKRGSSWYHTIIRAILNSQWSHVVLVIQGRLYESVFLKGEHEKSGVRDYPITDKIASDYIWLDLGTDGEKEALERYEIVRNYPYDLISEISFLPLLNARDSKRMYCGELVLWMLGGHVKWRVTFEIILTHVLRGKL
jgi:hypothetical protein